MLSLLLQSIPQVMFQQLLWHQSHQFNLLNSMLRMNLANTIMAILTQHQLNKNTKLQMVLCKEHIAMLMPMELCKRQIILLMDMDSVLPQPIYHKHQSPQLEEAINSKGFDYRYISKIFFTKSGH